MIKEETGVSGYSVFVGLWENTSALFISLGDKLQISLLAHLERILAVQE